MKNMHSITAGVILLGTTMAYGTNITSSKLIGVVWFGGRVVEVDVEQRTVATLGYLDLPRPSSGFNSLAQSPDGLLWTTYSSPDAPPNSTGGRATDMLVRFNWQTMETIQIPITGIPIPSIRSMTYYNNKLYAINYRGGSNPAANSLYEIDMQGRASYVADAMTLSNGILVPVTAAQNLATYGNEMFSYTDSGLMRINHETGEFTTILQSPGKNLQGIAFGPDGYLYGYGGYFSDVSTEYYFKINPSTGSTEIIPIPASSFWNDPNYPDIRGFEWVIPEPGSALLILIGLPLVIRRIFRS